MNLEKAYPQIYPAGEAAYVVEFGDAISPRLNEQVLRLDQSLSRHIEVTGLEGILDVTPTYRSLLVQFDPSKLSGDFVSGLLDDLLQAVKAGGADQDGIDCKRWQVPVCYDPEFGLDLDFLSQTLNLSIDDLIMRHASATYRVYMIGFSPGYTYLGGLPEDMAVPRRAAPRASVPASSIGIGGKQACIFSNATPSGWHLLGRTSLKLFDATREPPSLFGPGDTIHHRPIERKEYDALLKRVEEGDVLAGLVQLDQPESKVVES